MTDDNIKFIAADMDGTLLNEHGQLNPEFYDVFAQLEQKNIYFSAASGRQYYSLLDTFEPVRERLVYVADNGTMVMYQGKELYCCTIETAEARAIVETARSIEGTYIVLCGKGSAYIETQDPHALEEISKYYKRSQYVPDLLQVEDEFIKIALCHFGGTEALVYPTMNAGFGDSHQVVVSAKIWLDVMNKTASKGSAIEHLQQTLGFTRAQTMTFGDYFNDVEMLKVSDHSYAMANAHPEVKKLARFEAPSNRENGVLTVIKQTVLAE